jgi:hypothetical protein
MFLRTIYKALLDHVKNWLVEKFGADLHKNLSTPEQVKPIFDQYFPESAVKSMIQTGEVIPLDPGESLEEYICKCKSLQWTSNIKSMAVDFKSTKAICEAIEKRYKGVFQHKFDVRVWGNHDSFFKKENPYWAANFMASGWAQHNCDINGYLQSKTKSPDLGQWQFYTYPPESGGNPTVWIEHGHYYDWHNCDEHWADEDRGFDTVFRGPFGAFSKGLGKGYIDIKRSWPRVGTEGALEFADKWAELLDYEMRLPELRRADAICGDPYEGDDYHAKDMDPLDGTRRENRPILVIMGHTHGPGILECLREESFRTAYPPIRNQFYSYAYGKYFLDDVIWEKGGMSKWLIQKAIDDANQPL